MFYEVSREVFKQRVENPLQFAIVDLTNGGAGVPKVTSMTYSNEFLEIFTKEYTDKAQNILLFSFDNEDSSPKVAGKKLSDSGYTNVYYYLGDSKSDSLIGSK